MTHIRRLSEADFELIRSTITHPRVYPMASDDGSPAREDFTPAMDPRIYYLGAFDDEGRYLGLFQVDPMNVCMGNMHVCLLPLAYGYRAEEAGLAALAWLWANTAFKRLVGIIPTFNRRAIRYARACGMEFFGVSPDSWLKANQLWSVAFFGISKPEGAH